LATFIEPMIGLPAWGVRQGHGSFLTLEFGLPKLEVNERRSPHGKLQRSAYVQGQWHLWIYCCRWRAVQDGAELAWSDDDHQKIARATATLNAQKLVDVSVDLDEGRSSFTFDLGGALETWPGTIRTNEQWFIFTDGQSFAYRGDGHYACGPSSAPPDSQRWLPLR